MKRNFGTALMICATLLGGGSAINSAQARQLSDLWSGNPAQWDGDGGSTAPDRAVGSATVNVDFPSPALPTVTFTAARTWVHGTGGAPDHWAVVLNRYDYGTGAFHDAAQAYHTKIYPGPTAGKDFFVPIAMKVVQTSSAGSTDFSPEETRIIVTGYSRPAGDTSNTSITTLWFDANLSDPLIRAPFVPALNIPNHAQPAVDQYPVGMDALVGGQGTGAIIAVTGNVWNGDSWDIASVFYNINGKEINSDVRGTLGSTDMATGVSLGGSTQAVFVAGTTGVGTLSNKIEVFRYTPQLPNVPWPAPSIKALQVSGAAIQANALTARLNEFCDFGIVTGQLSGVDSTYMLLARFSFKDVGYVDYTTFAPPSPSTTGVVLASAQAVAYADATVDVSSHVELYAVAGWGWRDAAHGLESLVCLYDGSTSPPHLRWSSWMNQSDTAYAMDDSCYRVAINSVVNTHDLDKFYVYTAGQRSNGTDLDWRFAAFTSVAVGTDPTNPALKAPFGNTLEFFGSVPTPSPFLPDLIELPISLEQSLNLETGPNNTQFHNFILTGNIYNGQAAGADQLTRRVRFFAPE